MVKWKCTMCGYTDEGRDPQNQCPICGSPKDLFVKIKMKMINSR
ncbi:MAG: rubredoxin [Halobacteriota archaeon]|nr:rubredoxin [Halobacteriota archaeon]